MCNIDNDEFPNVEQVKALVKNPVTGRLMDVSPIFSVEGFAKVAKAIDDLVHDMVVFIDPDLYNDDVQDNLRQMYDLRDVFYQLEENEIMKNDESGI